MTSIFIFHAFCWVLVAVAGWAAIRLWLNAHTKMFFVNRDCPLFDQGTICIDPPYRRRSLLKLLLERAWEEEVELSLMDYRNTPYTFLVQFHFWRGYSLVPKKISTCATLDGIECKELERIRLKSGMVLEIGNRKFAVNFRIVHRNPIIVPSTVSPSAT
jgi:hypothetical protein